MKPLNLPAADFKIKKLDGKVWIFDGVRKKFVVLTPEEWVRQHFINYLIVNHNYPRSLFRIEGSLAYNTMQKRSDILVFDRNGKPWMLIECKSPDIKLSQNAFNQAGMYNMTVGACYVAVTNGMVHYCWLAPKAGEAGIFQEDFPSFEEDGLSSKSNT